MMPAAFGVDRRAGQHIAKGRRRIVRQLHAGIEPDVAERRPGRVGDDGCDEPWHAGDGVFRAVAPRECEHRVASSACRLKRDVLAGKRLAEAPARGERACRDEHLDPAVPALGEQFRRHGPVVRVARAQQLVQELSTMGVVDRPAVIRIDEVQVPKLGALVEVGNAGRGDLDHKLGEAIVDPKLCDPCLKRDEGVEKRRRTAGIENRPDEALDGVFVLLVGIEPAGVDLRLAKRLRHVRADALDECVCRRLRAVEGLPEPA